MIIQAPPKRYGLVQAGNFHLQPKVREWSDNCCFMDPNCAVSVKELYNSFQGSVLSNKLTDEFQCSKPVFFILLQVIYEKEFQEGSVFVITKLAKFIYGLRVEK